MPLIAVKCTLSVWVTAITYSINDLVEWIEFAAANRAIPRAGTARRIAR